MHHIFLGLGSNIENRHNYLKKAISLIENQIGEVKQQSKIYETKAWGIENQENFLNLALEVITPFFPLKVLEKILEIELLMGRKREIKWSSRNIDIDLLFFENYVFETPSLTVPHPYISQRNFVLSPLNDVCPDFIHPKFNKTIKQLSLETSDVGWIKEI